MFSKIFNSLKKYYWFIIVLVILISNGQTLFMLPWQDDNALFFKLGHISENVGFLGPGIFGQGAYKYTAFFYYPIYLIFKYQPVFYFAFGITLFSLSVFVLYKVVSTILDKNVGMIAGFLFACGFIGSDSYIRIFNSVVTSLSVILVLFFLYAYWKFYKISNYYWYILSVLFFFLAGEFASARTHYLIIIPLVFELSLVVSKKPFIKSMVLSFIRLIPFLYLFNRYVLLEDNRSGQMVVLLKSLVAGNFYNTFGFFSSLSNLVLPNWLLGLTRSAQENVLGGSSLSNSIFYYIFYFLVLLIFLIFWVVRKNKAYKIFGFITLLFSIIWLFISLRIYTSPYLAVTQSQMFISFMGGELVYFFVSIVFFLEKKYRFMYGLFLSGIFMNLLSYSAYYPTNIYEKINRYFSHPLIYLVLLFALLFYANYKNRKTSVVIFVLLTLWGLGNLTESYIFQRRILVFRTYPVEKFYKELKRELPEIKKGDVILFDVADNMQGSFSDAFSVAQMPNTTAIAWRYGIDRYDFEMYTDPQDFLKNLSTKKISEEKIHAFFYSKEGFMDITDELKSYLSNRKSQLNLKLAVKLELSAIDEVDATIISKSEATLSPARAVKSVVPFKLLLEIRAEALPLDELRFPFRYGVTKVGSNKIYSDKKLLLLVQEYRHYKDAFLWFEVTASSYWQDREAANLTDGDLQSVWQADRLSWIGDDQFLSIKTNGTDFYDRIAFINTYSDSTLTELQIFASDNNLNWSLVDTIKNQLRYPNGDLMVFNFPSTKARFFKIVFKKTLNNDSPAISEMWLVPSGFSNLSISEAEEYLNEPFGYVKNSETYRFLLTSFNYKGELIAYWQNNKNLGWRSSYKSKVNIIYDGKIHYYELPVEPGGTLIDKLKFVGVDVPGTVEILSIKAEY